MVGEKVTRATEERVELGPRRLTELGTFPELAANLRDRQVEPAPQRVGRRIGIEEQLRLGRGVAAFHGRPIPYPKYAKMGPWK